MVTTWITEEHVGDMTRVLAANLSFRMTRLVVDFTVGVRNICGGSADNHRSGNGN